MRSDGGGDGSGSDGNPIGRRRTILEGGVARGSVPATRLVSWVASAVVLDSSSRRRRVRRRMEADGLRGRLRTWSWRRGRRPTDTYLRPTDAFGPSSHRSIRASTCVGTSRTSPDAETYALSILLAERDACTPTHARATYTSPFHRRSFLPATTTTTDREETPPPFSPSRFLSRSSEGADAPPQRADAPLFVPRHVRREGGEGRKGGRQMHRGRAVAPPLDVGSVCDVASCFVSASFFSFRCRCCFFFCAAGG